MDRVTTNLNAAIATMLGGELDADECDEIAREALGKECGACNGTGRIEVHARVDNSGRDDCFGAGCDDCDGTGRK